MMQESVSIVTNKLANMSIFLCSSQYPLFPPFFTFFRDFLFSMYIFIYATVF